MSQWNHAICDSCWDRIAVPSRPPIRDQQPERETCCFCGVETYSGIYRREDPSVLPHHTDHGAEDT